VFNPIKLAYYHVVEKPPPLTANAFKQLGMHVSMSAVVVTGFHVAPFASLAMAMAIAHTHYAYHEGLPG